MKISNFNWIFVLLILSVIIFSCNKDNNPVNSTPTKPLVIDSNFFDWHIDTARNTLSGDDMFIADTNQIFLPGTLYGIFFDNGTLRKINYLTTDPQFIAECVNGTNVKNVYFGGCHSSPIPFGYTPILKRWDGVGLINIELPKDSGSIIGRIEVISDNDIWMSTSSNLIYHYSNSEIISYKLDSGLSQGVIHKDNFGNLYAKYSKSFPGYPDVQLFYMFKYENDNWVQVYKDSIYGNNEIRGYSGIVDNQFIRIGHTGYYSFAGNTWSKFLNIGNLISGGTCAGNSYNNVLFHGIEEGLGLLVYYYDGKQIYRQPYYYLPDQMVWYIQYKFGRFYLILQSWDNFESYLEIATFKKTKSKIFVTDKNIKSNTI